MPKAFEDCVKKGGRVRTLTGPDKKFGLRKGQYRHICYLGKNSYMGHIKTKKKGR